MSQRLYVKAYKLLTPHSPCSLFSTFSCPPSHSLLPTLPVLYVLLFSLSLSSPLPVLYVFLFSLSLPSSHSPCSSFSTFSCSLSHSPLSLFSVSLRFPVFSLTPFFPLSLFFVLYVLLFSLSLPTLPVLHSLRSLVLPHTVYLLATTIPTLLKNAYDIVIIFQWKLSCIMILILTFLF